METKTHWKKLDNPNYLGAYSLMDGESKELIATIEKVVIEEVKTSSGSENCKVAYLKNSKPMILNTTNCKAIQKATGSPYIDDWAGQNITIFVAKIKAFGEDIDALRIRPTKAQKPELNPKSKNWDKAKKAIMEGTYTIDDILKKYTVTEENQKLLLS